MQLEQDKQVMLVITVKKRGLEGDVKVQLLLSSDDDGQGSGLTKQGHYKKSKASCATRKPRGPVIVGLDFRVLRWRR